jgi:hypothetical protein
MASDVVGPAYVDTDVVNGTRYYYVVSGQNTLGESGDSNEASAVPNIPPDVVVSSLALPAVAAAGSTVTAAVTTKNQGLGRADPSVDRPAARPSPAGAGTDARTLQRRVG